MGFDSVLKNEQNRLPFLVDAAKYKFKTWEDARSNIQKGITDIEKNVKEDAIKAKFQTLGEVFSIGGVKKEAQEKIYHQWAKIYQEENQKKVKPLKEKLATLTKQILSVKLLSDDIQGVKKSKASNMEAFSEAEIKHLSKLRNEVKPMIELNKELGNVKECFEILDSAVRTQETIFEKVHLTLKQIKTLEEDVKKLSDPIMKKIASKVLKDQKKNLEDIKKKLLNPEKIMKLFSSANYFQSIQEQLESTEKDINAIRFKITQEKDIKVINEAIEKAFRDTPFKMPSSIDYIQEILDKSGLHKGLIYALKVYTQGLQQICVKVNQTLEAYYEKNDNGDIDLKRPKPNQPDREKNLKLLFAKISDLRTSIQSEESTFERAYETNAGKQCVMELLVNLDRMMKPLEFIRSAIPQPPKGVEPLPSPRKAEQRSNLEALNVTQPNIEQVKPDQIQNIPDALKQLEIAFAATFKEIPFKEPENLKSIIDILQRLREIDRKNEGIYNELKAQVTSLYTVCIRKEAKELNQYGFRENKIDSETIKNNKQDLDRIMSSLFYEFSRIKLILKNYEKTVTEAETPVVKATLSNIEALINKAIENLRKVDKYV